jgi:hypothetical protein
MRRPVRPLSRGIIRPAGSDPAPTRTYLSLCETAQTIEIRGTVWDKMATVKIPDATRYCEFAVHLILENLTPGWRVTHLPTGCKIASAFPNQEAACGCMVETQRLRNNWVVINKDTLTRELLKEMALIVLRFQGVSDIEGTTNPRRHEEVYRQTPSNGYEDERWKR